MIRVPRLKQNRHGTFTLRVLWLDSTGKRRETQQSLGTKHPTLARLLALQFNEAFERKRAMSLFPKLPNIDHLANKFELDLSKGIMKSDGLEDFERMKQAIEIYKNLHGTFPPLQEAMDMGKATLPTPEPQKRVIPRSKTLSEALKGYLQEKEFDNAKRTLYEKGLLFDEFKGLLGDLEVNIYDKPTLVQWKNHELNKGAGASRINKRLGYLNDFFKWCIGNGVSQHQQSPIEGLLISSKTKLAKKAEHWKKFTETDLKAIYGAGYCEAMPKPDHYWIPLIALYSGARLNEIAAIPIAHVQIIDGVHALEITDTKTSKVGRVVPVHQALLDLGFWDYVEHVRSLGATRLFPHLVDGNNGYGKNAARQFALRLDKLGITDRHKVFHSTRSTIITQLHSENVDAGQAMQITGHEGIQTANIHFQAYFDGVGLQKLRDSINQVRYALDLDQVKASDPTFKSFLHRWKMQEARKIKTVKKAIQTKQ